MTSKARSVYRDAMRLSIQAPPQLAVWLESQTESPEPLSSFTREVLQTVASSIGSTGASLKRVVEKVPTIGRFTCEAFGSERVGCFLCKTNPMIKWSWHDHASSRKHVAHVEVEQSKANERLGEVRERRGMGIEDSWHWKHTLTEMLSSREAEMEEYYKELATEYLAREGQGVNE